MSAIKVGKGPMAGKGQWQFTVTEHRGLMLHTSVKQRDCILGDCAVVMEPSTG